MKFPGVCIAEGLRIKNKDLQHKKTGSLSEPPLTEFPLKSRFLLILKYILSLRLQVLRIAITFFAVISTHQPP